MTPFKVAQWAEESDVIIAADSGFLRTLEAGFVPDIAIGDFDSVPIEIAETAKIAHFDEGQDDTDCAKLLRYAKYIGYNNISIICTEGDLIDHQIDAIHSAAKADLTVRFGLNRGIGVIVKGPNNYSFVADKGSRLSLLPITHCKAVSLSGAKWSFEDKTMDPLGFTSISNEVEADSVDISIEQGVAYLFLERETPLWY